MKINSVKIISLLFFVLSAFYLYTAHQIQVFAFDEGAPFNAKTFPIYLGYAGMFFAALKILLPEKSIEEVNHNVLMAFLLRSRPCKFVYDLALRHLAPVSTVKIDANDLAK